VSYLALEGGIGRLEGDGTASVLEVEGDLAAWLAAGRPLAALAGLPVRAGAGLPPPVGLLAPGAAVYGVGLNYRSKLEASGRQLPEHPTLFLKSPAALSAPGALVALPPAAPECVDYEGEIAVVLAAPLEHASPAEAEAAIGAVAAANDVTARDVMRETGNPTLAKSFPGFLQLGSAVLDPATTGGVSALELSTRVNGELRQADRGAGMLIPVGELLALLSRYVRLRPGDVVLTGTPAGTGDETKTYLAPGDVVEVRVGALPPLRSEFAASGGGPQD